MKKEKNNQKIQNKTAIVNLNKKNTYCKLFNKIQKKIRGPLSVKYKKKKR